MSATATKTHRALPPAERRRNALKNAMQSLRQAMRRAEVLIMTTDDSEYSRAVSQSKIARAKTIVGVVATRFDVHETLIWTRDRTKDVALARQVAMVMVHEKLGYILEVVGAIFRRDSGAVVWAKKAVSDCLEVDPKFKAKYEACLAEVEEKLNLE